MTILHIASDVALDDRMKEMSIRMVGLRLKSQAKDYNSRPG
jgi:hypothetical protein